VKPRPWASLAQLNTLRIPHRTRFLSQARHIDDLRQALEFGRRHGLPVAVLGEGSNLVPAADWPGLIIRLRLRGRKLIAQDSRHFYLQVAAGENWQELLDHCLERNYHGLENLSRIPGSVGAAPVQNIGAYGVELSELLHELEALDPDTGQLLRMSAADCGFSYRHSVFKGSLRGRRIITSITLRLDRHHQPRLDHAALRRQLGRRRPTARNISQAVTTLRRARLPDPRRFPNAGSFFHNPIVPRRRYEELTRQHGPMSATTLSTGRFKLHAGWLLEELGWKGYCGKGLGISSRHALVLINYRARPGHAVLDLARTVSRSVEDHFGIRLQMEPQVLQA